MCIFDGDYLSDEQIWSRIEKLEKEEEKVRRKLAQPEVSTEPSKLENLSKKLDLLEEISKLACRLRNCLEDLVVAEELEDGNGGEEAEGLVQDYRKKRDELSEALFQLLLENGYLPEEGEDELDIKILQFIQKVGPEYPWGLAKNQNLDVKQAREKLEILLKKGFLERVEGTMLESYHRQEGWDKHMNHTYYRLSRKGKHYLRDLRRNY